MKSSLSDYISQADQRRTHFLAFFFHFLRIELNGRDCYHSGKRGAFVDRNLLVIIPCLFCFQSFSSPKLAGKPENDRFQLSFGLREKVHQGFWLCKVSNCSVNDCKCGNSCVKLCSFLLGASPQAIADRVGNQPSENPSKQNPKRIIRYLKSMGWYIGHHLWLFPVSWIMSFAFGWRLSVHFPVRFSRN